MMFQHFAGVLRALGRDTDWSSVGVETRNTPKVSTVVTLKPREEVCH